MFLVLCNISMDQPTIMDIPGPGSQQRVKCQSFLNWRCCTVRPFLHWIYCVCAHASSCSSIHSKDKISHTRGGWKFELALWSVVLTSTFHICSLPNSKLQATIDHVAPLELKMTAINCKPPWVNESVNKHKRNPGYTMIFYVTNAHNTIWYWEIPDRLTSLNS